jgi:hypothetical protein
MSCKSVDFPEPEGPRIAVSEPCPISAETSLTAFVLP